MSETTVVKWINGEQRPPLSVAELVEKYRGYAKQRGECVSYPIHVDQDMNSLYDLLLEVQHAEQES